MTNRTRRRDETVALLALQAFLVGVVGAAVLGAAGHLPPLAWPFRAISARADTYRCMNIQRCPSRSSTRYLVPCSSLSTSDRRVAPADRACAQ